MTANHAHTPTTEQVRMDYIQASEGDRVSAAESGPEFDRWLAERDARIEAAAEQRGAVKALRDAADSGLFVGPIADLLEQRADQMEGDE
jgi:hypothetical protein